MLKLILLFKDFNKKDIVRYKKNRIDYQVLITKNKMKKEYEKYIKNYEGEYTIKEK